MRVSFSPYVLDLESRQLLRGDDVVRLSPKAFDLLSILVSHRPKALSKSDLQERLWPASIGEKASNIIPHQAVAEFDLRQPSKPRPNTSSAY